EVVELEFVELGLWVLIAEQGVSDPVEGNEVFFLPRGFHYLDGCWDGSALVMPFVVEQPAGAVDGVGLADRDERSRTRQDVAEVELLPVGGELRNQINVGGLVGLGFVCGNSHSGTFHGCAEAKCSCPRRDR